jgi:hypothetical protein
MQPVIGALSDRNTSRFGRRRPYIALGSIMVCLSLLGVAFARDIADVAMNVLGGQSEDSLGYAVCIFLHYILITELVLSEYSFTFTRESLLSYSYGCWTLC